MKINKRMKDLNAGTVIALSQMMVKLISEYDEHHDCYRVQEIEIDELGEITVLDEFDISLSGLIDGEIL